MDPAASSHSPVSGSALVTLELLPPLVPFLDFSSYIPFFKLDCFSASFAAFPSSPHCPVFLSTILNLYFFAFPPASSQLYRTCLCHETSCVNSRPATFDDIRDACDLLHSFPANAIAVLPAMQSTITAKFHKGGNGFKKTDKLMQSGIEPREVERIELLLQVEDVMEVTKRVTETLKTKEFDNLRWLVKKYYE